MDLGPLRISVSGFRRFDKSVIKVSSFMALETWKMKAACFFELSDGT